MPDTVQEILQEYETEGQPRTLNHYTPKEAVRNAQLAFIKGAVNLDAVHHLSALHSTHFAETPEIEARISLVSAPSP
eukprot:tig00000128_g7225.t1